MRSQTIYHALAYAMQADSPDTIVVSRPNSPYVCTGFHQDAAQEVDLEYCRQQHIPVIRRETGGGTVYIDAGQIFVQWIFQPQNLPRKLDARFSQFIEPLLKTYQFFGINTYLHPPNDVHVKGKKIVGTGAAAIGNAEVVTGNFILDFDAERMKQILKVPDEAFREMFAQSMLHYMSSMTRELGQAPDAAAIIKVYEGKCAEVLKRQLVPGNFSEAELAWMDNLDKKFATEAWLLEHPKPSSDYRLAKVHADVWVGSTSTLTAGGSIRTTLRMKGNRIDKISFSGDFTMNPATRQPGLENVLRNVDLLQENIEEVLEAWFALHGAETPGISIKDWTTAVMAIKTIKP